MNLYIMIDGNGDPLNHPILEENLIQVFEGAPITDQLLAEKGYARFERPTLEPTVDVIAEHGYETGEDGIVRPILETRELTLNERIDLWVRRPRDWLLAVSDWTDLPNAPFSADKKTEWQTYRQALRDLTKNITTLHSPSEVVFPTRPA